MSYKPNFAGSSVLGEERAEEKRGARRRESGDEREREVGEGEGES